MAPKSAMEELLKRRTLLCSRLTRAEADAVALAKPPVDLYSAKIEMDLLENLGVEIQSLEDTILVTCSTDDFDAQQAELTAMVKRYKSVKLQLMKLMNPPSAAPSNTQQPPVPDPNVPQPSPPQIKLPKLELPRFSGGLLEWMSFRDRFKAAVHDKEMPGSLKLQYLMGQLDGAAAAFIQGVPSTDTEYDDCWKALVKRFENKRELARTHLDRLLNQATALNGTSTSLRSLVDTTRECIRTLKSLGLPTEHWDFFVCHMISRKLNSDTKLQWERTFEDDSLPSLEKFLEFLDREARSHAASGSEPRLPSAKLRGQDHDSQKTAHLAVNSNTCKLCSEVWHPLFRCPKFDKMSVPDRIAWVEGRNLCLNCFKRGHLPADCENRACKTCNEKHHSMLHADTATVSGPTTTAHHSSGVSGSTVLLATAVALVRDSEGCFQEVRCMLDSGSQSTFIREDCVQRLGLKKDKVRATFLGVGETPQCTVKAAVNAILRSRTDESFEMSVKALVLPTVTGMQPLVPVKNEDWPHLRQLQLADPNFHVPARVDLILGGDVYNELLTSGILKGKIGIPTAICTSLGWVLSGPVRASQPQLTLQSFHACCELEKIVKKFWSFESVPDKKGLSVEEKACETHFLRTFTRDDTGRFIVRLPFKECTPLGDSRKIALRRWFQCEQKLSKQPELRTKYNEVLQEYLDMGHMELVPYADLMKPPSQVAYLPHHAVFKEESTTTKVRVVFDASAKTTSGISLNETQMIGATIQDDILSILIRARKHQILFTADIAKMYRQVNVHPDDRDFQRIIWRKANDEHLKEYRLRTVTFGVASAPFLAIRSLRKLAEDEKKIIL